MTLRSIMMWRYRDFLFLILCIFIIQFVFMSEKEGFQSQQEIGFFIPRCVRKPEHNILYKECYEAVRRYHPDVKIIFIDDNSDKEVLVEHEMTNVEIIQSEYRAGGEYLCYWYMLERKPFKKAIFIQDSMILNGSIPYERVDDYMFLYEFPSVNLSSTALHSLLDATKNPEEIKSYCMQGVWKGCWGSMMIVTGEFINRLEDTFGISNWVTIIHSREYRMALESAIGVLCSFLQPKDTVSIFGQSSDMNVMKYPGNEKHTLDMYLADKKRIKDSIIKVWNGR